MAHGQTPRRGNFEGFLDTPHDMKDIGMERRMEAIERRIGTIAAIEGKLDQVLKENDTFRREVYNLTKENCKLLKEKVELESKNSQLDKKCEELKLRIVDMEKKLSEGEERGKEACASLIDSKIQEVKKNNEEAQTSFKEIIKQQEKERSELAQSEIVKVLCQKEAVVRNIAERKRSVIVSGLKEDNIRNWQERKTKEEERIKILLNTISEEEDVYAEVEDYMRLGKYEEGKTRAMKITLKSQVAAESLLRHAWRLKGSEETKMIYVRRNMTEEERTKMREMVTEVKVRNEARSEEDKKKFFWKVRGGRVWKWRLDVKEGTVC